MDIGILLGMVCAGAIIGLFYFGALWLTLNKLTETKRWGLWLGASFLVRCTITVTAFWLLGAGDWRRLLALAAGFTLVRFLSVKQIHNNGHPANQYNEK